MITSVFVPDRDIANSDEAMSDKELFASKCLCLGTILANLVLMKRNTRYSSLMDRLDGNKFHVES